MNNENEMMIKFLEEKGYKPYGAGDLYIIEEYMTFEKLSKCEIVESTNVKDLYDVVDQHGDRQFSVEKI